MQVSKIIIANETTVPNLVFTKLHVAPDVVVLKVTHAEASAMVQANQNACFALDGVPADLTQEQLNELAQRAQEQAIAQQNAEIQAGSADKEAISTEQAAS